MKKVFVFLLLFFGLAANAIVIKGGIHYTVETARQEAFSKVKYSIPMDEHKKYLSDPGFSRDKNGKTKIRKFGRDVTFFSDGSYGVYNSNKKISYYYNNNGKLEEISYTFGDIYPKLTVKYNIDGKLNAVTYEIQKGESYMYDANKCFMGHWVDKNCYDSNGDIILMRK